MADELRVPESCMCEGVEERLYEVQAWVVHLQRYRSRLPQRKHPREARPGNDVADVGRLHVEVEPGQRLILADDLESLKQIKDRAAVFPRQVRHPQECIVNVHCVVDVIPLRKVQDARVVGPLGKNFT